MNCSDCSEKLDSYLDRELNNTEMLELQLHLEGCPPCADNYEFQASMKRLVKVCCEQDKAPEAFREKLRQIAEDGRTLVVQLNLLEVAAVALCAAPPGMIH